MTNAEAISIVDHAMLLLTDASKWNPDSDAHEECDEAGDTFTLACALKTAHHVVLGPDGFESRSKVMKKVRWMIRRYFLLRHGIHPITHFNKHVRTTHADVLFVLAKAKKGFSD